VRRAEITNMLEEGQHGAPGVAPSIRFFCGIGVNAKGLSRLLYCISLTTPGGRLGKREGVMPRFIAAPCWNYEHARGTSTLLLCTLSHHHVFKIIHDALFI